MSLLGHDWFLPSNIYCTNLPLQISHLIKSPKFSHKYLLHMLYLASIDTSCHLVIFSNVLASYSF